MMNVSPDGLIRLQIKELHRMPLIHMASGLDSCGDEDEQACGRACDIYGFSEWTSTGQPGISLGWDWCLQTSVGRPRWQRVGPLRTNVMLVNDQGCDYDWAHNLEALSRVVDTLPWQYELPQQLGELETGAAPRT
jgi:hypothetical protein